MRWSLYLVKTFHSYYQYVPHYLDFHKSTYLIGKVDGTFLRKAISFLQKKTSAKILSTSLKKNVLPIYQEYHPKHIPWSHFQTYLCKT